MSIYRIFARITLGGFLGAFLVSSCTKSKQSAGFEYMPDMYRSPSIEAYMDYQYPDSLQARKPAEGTIPFSEKYLDEPYNLNLPYPYSGTTKGLDSAAEHLKNPLPFTKANYEEGEKLFVDYCSHCHGEEGKGQGPLVENGNYPPPPPYTNNPEGLTEGKIYHLIMRGSVSGLMGPHASQLEPEQRWQIVHYVTTLRGEIDPTFQGKVKEGKAEKMNQAKADTASSE